jgi:hypothetical protein
MAKAWSLFEGSLFHSAQLIVADPQGLELRKALEGLAVQDPNHVVAQINRFQGWHLVQCFGNLEILTR